MQNRPYTSKFYGATHSFSKFCLGLGSLAALPLKQGTRWGTYGLRMGEWIGYKTQQKSPKSYDLRLFA